MIKNQTFLLGRRDEIGMPLIARLVRCIGMKLMDFRRKKLTRERLFPREISGNGPSL
jgi:hypothetical protein